MCIRDSGLKSEASAQTSLYLHMLLSFIHQKERNDFISFENLPAHISFAFLPRPPFVGGSKWFKALCFPLFLVSVISSSSPSQQSHSSPLSHTWLVDTVVLGLLFWVRHSYES